jgi:uncharacterized membrane protein YccC
MSSVAEFSAEAWGLVVLIGIMLAMLLVTLFFLWLSYKEWKAARRAEKGNAEDVKRLIEISKRIAGK